MEALAIQHSTSLIKEQTSYIGGKVIPLFGAENTQSSSADSDYIDNTKIEENQYKDSYTSEIHNLFFPVPDHRTTFLQRNSDFNIKVIRTLYSKKILSCTDWLSNNHTKETSYISVNFFSKLQILIKEFITQSSSDPFGSFLLSIYDGLTFENAWINTEQSTFKALSKYIKELNNQNLDYKKVDKYIMKLEKLNINVLPY